jgi:hypothetical protein
MHSFHIWQIGEIAMIRHRDPLRPSLLQRISAAFDRLAADPARLYWLTDLDMESTVSLHVALACRDMLHEHPSCRGQ